MTFPITFANQPGPVPLSYLDQNFGLIASSAGAATVGWIQLGAGAILRTVSDKLRDWVHVKDFGAVGDGSTNDTAAINAALLAGLRVDFGGSDKSYKVDGALLLRSGHNIRGDGATITQVTNNTEIFNIAGKSDISISGGNFVGVGIDYTDSDSSHSVAIYGTGGETRIRVFNNRFTNFSYTPFRVVAGVDCSFVNNVVVGPGTPTLTPVTSGKCYGVLFDAGSVGVLIEGNSISKTAQGIRIETCTDVRIAGNRIFNITGQHGMYIGSGMTNVSVVGNTINTISLIGIKVQAQDTIGIDNTQVSVIGNVITAPGDQGILFTNGTVGGVYKVKNSVISGNSIFNAGANGINLSDCTGVVVSGNVIKTTGQAGITMGYSTQLLIASNKIDSSALSGIRDATACTFVNILGNTIKDCCTANTGGDNFGSSLEKILVL